MPQPWVTDPFAAGDGDVNGPNIMDYKVHWRYASRMATDAYVVAGARTPFGKYGGSLSHLRLEDLLGLSMVARVRALRGSTTSLRAA